MAAPMRSSRAGSQLQAVVTSAGKQVAGRDSFTPSISPLPSCFRSPWGPSHMKRAGMLYCSKAFVSQKVAPEQSAICSSGVICRMMPSMSMAYLLMVWLPGSSVSSVPSGRRSSAVQLAGITTL